MKKIFLIPLFAVLVLGVALAGAFVVSKLTLNVGVAEPFSVEYAVLGDAGTYNVAEDGTCLAPIGNVVWFTAGSQSMPVGDMLVGESRKLCVRITNMAEGVVPYTMAATFNDEACKLAFGDPQPILGNALANTHGGTGAVTVNGVLVQPAFDAIPVSNCEVAIELARG